MFGLQLSPDEKQLLPYRGMPVCVLMKDGSRKVGQLTACRAGRLILNGEGGGGGEAASSRKNGTRRTKRVRSRAAKPKDPSVAERPVPQGEFDELSLAPFGLEPVFSSLPRENVPLHNVDSILLL